MKRILSEKNLAIFLFVMVMIAFSFAHEDSKKRDLNYRVSSPPESVSRFSTTFISVTLPLTDKGK